MLEHAIDIEFKPFAKLKGYPEPKHMKDYVLLYYSPPWLQTQWQSFLRCSPSHLWISSQAQPDGRSGQQSGDKQTVTR